MLYAAKTDVGKVRPQNEDSCLAEIGDAYALFIVADGMGGHLAGEVASQMAVLGVSERCRKYHTTMEEGMMLLRRCVSETNRDIYIKSQQDEKDSGMGTTITCAIIRDGVMSIAHVGDSRLYLLRKNELTQVTKDHSYVAELVRLGHITEEEAQRHPQRNVITRALGGESIVKVDTDELKVRAGDIILICSDGLTNYVFGKRLSKLLSGRKSPDDKAKALIKEALDAGGSDNITAVIIEVEERDTV